MRRLLRGLAVLTTLGMFVVLVMGALVTTTGSGHGCNNTWPLCNGRFIPEYTVSALIEWSHRAVTGIVSLLALALAVGTTALYRRRRETWVLVPAMIVFLILQAALGAIAAGTHETPAVLALHFGVSLISFASIALTTAFLFGLRGGDALRDRPVARGTRWLILGTLAYTYVVVYSGAYVRHSGSMLACFDWPLCTNTAGVPLFSAYVLSQLAHRAAAGALTLVVIVLWLNVRRARAARPDLYRGATAALATVALQALSGGIVVLSRAGLITQLLHAGLVSLLFISLAYLAYGLIPRRVCLPRSEGARTPRPSAVGASAK